MYTWNFLLQVCLIRHLPSLSPNLTNFKSTQLTWIPVPDIHVLSSSEGRHSASGEVARADVRSWRCVKVVSLIPGSTSRNRNGVRGRVGPSTTSVCVLWWIFSWILFPDDEVRQCNILHAAHPPLALCAWRHVSTEHRCITTHRWMLSLSVLIWRLTISHFDSCILQQAREEVSHNKYSNLEQIRNEINARRAKCMVDQHHTRQSTFNQQ